MNELTEEDKALLAALEIPVPTKNLNTYTSLEERIIAGFADITNFFATHGRLPQYREDGDIFERLYAVRFDCLREQTEYLELLTKLDQYGLLNTSTTMATVIDQLDDATLLAKLEVKTISEVDITQLTHVQSQQQKQINVAEEIASRTACHDFDKFKPLFEQVQYEIRSNLRDTPNFGKKNTKINKGEFFILLGQTIFIADVGKFFDTEHGRKDSRLRVIYDNGTESNILHNSLQRAMYKDKTARRISRSNIGPLFGDIAEQEELESGTIYVLRSKSTNPKIQAHRELVHKIGVTGGQVETRIANAAIDPTYLLANVEVVATYKLFNINRIRLENILHKIFASTQLDLEIQDRFGKLVKPKEWFLVPLHIIDEVIAKIQNQTIMDYIYDSNTVTLIKLASRLG